MAWLLEADKPLLVNTCRQDGFVSLNACFAAWLLSTQSVSQRATVLRCLVGCQATTHCVFPRPSDAARYLTRIQYMQVPNVNVLIHCSHPILRPAMRPCPGPAHPTSGLTSFVLPWQHANSATNYYMCHNSMPAQIHTFCAPLSSLDHFSRCLTLLDLMAGLGPRIALRMSRVKTTVSCAHRDHATRGIVRSIYRAQVRRPCIAVDAWKERIERQDRFKKVTGKRSDTFPFFSARIRGRVTCQPWACAMCLRSWNGCDNVKASHYIAVHGGDKNKITPKRKRVTFSPSTPEYSFAHVHSMTHLRWSNWGAAIPKGGQPSAASGTTAKDAPRVALGYEPVAAEACSVVLGACQRYYDGVVGL